MRPSLSLPPARTAGSSDLARSNNTPSDVHRRPQMSALCKAGEVTKLARGKYAASSRADLIGGHRNHTERKERTGHHSPRLTIITKPMGVQMPPSKDAAAILNRRNGLTEDQEKAVVALYDCNRFQRLFFPNAENGDDVAEPFRPLGHFPDRRGEGRETDEGCHVQASQVCRADRRCRALMQYRKRRVSLRLSRSAFSDPNRSASRRPGTG